MDTIPRSNIISSHKDNKALDFLLLAIRLWLGYRLIGASYSSIIGILTSPSERTFFEKWFGEELDFPAPVVMAFLAKGSEVLGGALLIVGWWARPASILIAFTMTIATVSANLGENFIIDGGFTISYVLFAMILLYHGAGKYALDALRRRKKNVPPMEITRPSQGVLRSQKK